MKRSYPLLKNSLKEKTLYGSFVTFGLGDIAEYTAKLGFDYIIIDNEHGILDHSTISDMVRASQCWGVPAIVRCTNDNSDNIHKALDMGADGILVPVINTAEEARKVVMSSLYAPKGERGIAYFTRAASYGILENKAEYLKESNEEIFISIQIETASAIKNLDEILDVEGIDMFFIGPNDLAASLGISASSSEMKEIIKETINKIISKGKIAGIFANDVESAKEFKNLGVNFILTSITKYMTEGALKYLEEAKK